MPERVTKEERRISLAIEKARSAKELLHQSLYDGNRLPDEKDDRMEKVKTKRPKAEKDKTKIETNDGTHSGYGKGGEETHFKKRQIDRPSDSGQIKAQEKLIAYFKSAYMPALRTYSMMNEKFEKEVMGDANKVLKHLEDSLESLKTQEKMFDDPKYRKRRHLG